MALYDAFEMVFEIKHDLEFISGKQYNLIGLQILYRYLMFLSFREAFYGIL